MSIPNLPSSLPPVEFFQQSLRWRHLEQLRTLELPILPVTRGPQWPTKDDKPTPYEQLVEWSKTAKEQIAKAVDSQVVSPESIDWNIEVFTLLECAAVDLRNNDKVVQAAILAHERTEEADKKALELLEDSQTEIKKIAALWGLNFEVVCDLVKYSPQGHSYLSGPYCGVFWSNDTSKPFLGLAFKGTNMNNWKEVLNDLYLAMMKAVGNILWGSPVHSGFYRTMFDKFPAIGLAPLDYIKGMIDTFLQKYDVPEGITINLHVTGHSLGAAYATLLYSELMRLYNDTPAIPALESEGDAHAEHKAFFSKLKVRQFVLRDLYTFGCPRSGGVKDRDSWAKNYVLALGGHTGQSWRVENKDDPVTMVPPVLPFVSTWNHVDNAYQISDDAPPKQLPTEVGTKPGVYFGLKFANHWVGKYFQNLYNAAVASSGTKIQVACDETEVEPPSSEYLATLTAADVGAE